MSTSVVACGEPMMKIGSVSPPGGTGRPLSTIPWEPGARASAMAPRPTPVRPVLATCVVSGVFHVRRAC